MPFAPRNWEAAVVVTSIRADGPRAAHLSGEVYAGEDTFISWAVTNLGSQSINQAFFVDLMLDGVVIKRWTNERGVSRNGNYFVDDWRDIGSLIRPYSGLHTPKLIVDPTNVVLETDESDNSFEYVFEWLEPADSRPPPVPQGIFDLASAVPERWPESVIASTIIGGTTNGDLSVNLQTHVSYGFRNLGETELSALTIIPVYMYFDEVLVNIEYLHGNEVTEDGVTVTWGGLHKAVHISEGRHRLTIEIDPLNQVLEINETNNVKEADFVWGPAVANP